MKYILGAITGALVMTITVQSSDKFNIQTPDEAAINTIVESVATLADRGDFESLEKLYSQEVEVDYTSAFGGEVELKSPQALMTQWANVLPGFDRTRHKISNIETIIKGNQANASADVIANHYLKDNFWQISGSYEYSLIKEDGQWVIEKMTFIAASEEGNRELINQAIEQTNLNPANYIKRQQTKQAVIDFLTALEDKNMEKFASLWSEDAVQDMPFSPEGFPKRVEGKANLIKHYSAWPEISGKASFTDELVFYPLQDSTMVFAEWKGKVEIVPTKRLYQQRYGGLFHVVDGKIELFREYYDPIVFKYAFGLDEDK